MNKCRKKKKTSKTENILETNEFTFPLTDNDNRTYN